MKHPICYHVSSGCNVPEGECNEACMTEKKQPEALDTRWLRNVANAGRGSSMTDALHKAADEIDRLHALCEEQKRLLEQARVALVNSDERRNPIIAAITRHLLQQEGEKK